MRYYYVNRQNQAIGPVEQAVLETLRRENVIGDDSRVSREGDTAWRTYGESFSAPPATGAIPPPLPRPVSIMVFGICNIFFGAKGVLCCPFSALGAFVGAAGSTFAGQSTLSSGWQVFSAVMSVFVSVAMLASGIGLVRYLEWGRKLALICALAEVALVVGSVGLLVIDSPFQELARSEESLVRVIMFFQLLAGLAYPIVLFLFLRRPAMRDALLAQE